MDPEEAFAVVVVLVFCFLRITVAINKQLQCRSNAQIRLETVDGARRSRLLRGAAGSRRDGAGAEGGHGGWLCRSRAQGFRHRPHPRPPGPDAVLPRKDTWGPVSLSLSVHLTLHPGADLLPSFCPGALPRSQPDAQVGGSYPSPQPLLVPETNKTLGSCIRRSDNTLPDSPVLFGGPSRWSGER